MAGDVRQQDPPAPTPEPYLGTRRRFPLVNRSMSVRVTARFYDPVRVEYSRCYEASKSFQATNDICAALLRRVEHCTEELMTRKDATALQPNPDRPLRYEITFNFIGAPFPTKERTFRSYQRKPPTMDQATEVILATDRMIGLFFMRHDGEFRWISGPVKEYLSARSRTAKPSVRGPESLCCVPRSRFIPETQSYEYLPGYEMELSFTSMCSTRHRQKIHKKIFFSSAQCSPLNLAFGEELLSASSRAIESAVDSRRRCLKSFRWLGAMNDSVTVDLRISNNLGPDHDHLTYQLHSKQGLFNHPTGLDCQEFLEEIERTLGRIRDGVDDAIGDTDELEIKVIRLDGPMWEACEPLTISLDPSVSYSRRTIEAILDRVQTGIAGVLHGNDLAITLSAHHRGHLVLDKTLIAHKKNDPGRPALAMTPEQEGNEVLSKLSHRIRSDIVMVCKDTCSLVDPGDALPNLSVTKKGQATLAAHVPKSIREPAESLHEQPQVITPPPSSHSSHPEEREVITPPPTTNHPEERALSIEPANPGDDASKASEAHDPPSPSEDGRTVSEHFELTPPSTPSLIDGGMETPRERDSLLITPEEMRHRTGTLGLMDFGPRIISDEINDPIIRDFAHFDHRAESPSNDNGYGNVMPLPEPKSRHFSPDVPVTPTPIRAAVILPVPEEREIVPVIQIELPAEVDLKEEIEYEAADTMKEVVSEAGDDAEVTEETVQPVMEGWLEYRCEPLSPVEEEPESAEVPDPVAEPVVEGWLEYWCEPLESDDDQSTKLSGYQEPAVQPVMEGWLEYCCEPLVPEDQQPDELNLPSGSQPTAHLSTGEGETTREEAAAPLKEHNHLRLGEDEGRCAISVGGASTVPSVVSSDESHSDSSSSLYSASECQYQDAPQGKASAVASPSCDTSERQADNVEETASVADSSDEEQETCSDTSDSTDSEVQTDELEEAIELSHKGSLLTMSLADTSETLSVTAGDDDCLEAFKIHLDDESLKTSSEPTTVAVTLSEDEGEDSDDESLSSSESASIPAFVQDEPLGIKGKGVLPPDDHEQSSTTPSSGIAGTSTEVAEALLPLARKSDKDVVQRDAAGTGAETVQAEEKDKPTNPQLSPPNDVGPSASPTEESPASDEAGKCPWLPCPRGPNPALGVRPASALFSFPSPIRALTTSALDYRPRTAVPFSRPGGPHTRTQSMSTANHLGLHDEYRMPLHGALLGPRASTGFFASGTASRASPVLSPVTAQGVSGSSAKDVSGLSDLADPGGGHAGKATDEEGSKAEDREDTDDGVKRMSGYSAIPGFMMFAAGITFASSMLGGSTAR